ncbi:MAG: hypothetical protein V7K97_17025 [Nostoc sp.]|uniref:hypothetical protein n=1 Tax=Nostoc sp. TaxID=1180 RepID=UPI002FF94413
MLASFDLPRLHSARVAQLSTTQLVERTPSGILLRVASPRVIETNGYGKFITRIHLNSKTEYILAVQTVFGKHCTPEVPTYLR